MAEIDPALPNANHPKLANTYAFKDFAKATLSKIREEDNEIALNKHFVFLNCSDRFYVKKDMRVVSYEFFEAMANTSNGEFGTVVKYEKEEGGGLYFYSYTAPLVKGRPTNEQIDFLFTDMSVIIKALEEED